MSLAIVVITTTFFACMIDMSLCWCWNRFCNQCWLGSNQRWCWLLLNYLCWCWFCCRFFLYWCFCFSFSCTSTRRSESSIICFCGFLGLLEWWLIFIWQIVGVLESISILNHFLIDIDALISNISKQSPIFISCCLTGISFELDMSCSTQQWCQVRRSLRSITLNITISSRITLRGI